MTKIVTAMAVMMLADRGALNLDAPATGQLPEMASCAGRVADHSASSASAFLGLVNPPPVRWVRPPVRWVRPAGEPPPGARAFLGRLLRRHRRLRFRPGAASYRNLGYVVMGELIASCSGQPYGEFVRR